MRLFVFLLALLALPALIQAQHKTDLIAGQHYDAGDVCTSINDDGDLQIDIMAQNGWVVKTFAIWIGQPGEEYPWRQNPAPGRFTYQGSAGSLQLIVTPAQLGLESWEAGQKLVIATHADVCLGESSETAWAAGPLSLGKNWATGYCVSICESEQFDADEFNTAAYNPDATIRVQHNGGSPALPYFWGSISGGYLLPTWCVDLSRVIASNRDYCAVTVSATDPRAGQYVAIPSGLALATYILNEYQIGAIMSDGQALAAGSIQRALWLAVFGSARSAGEGPYSNDHIAELLSSAAINAPGYQVPCSGVVPVVVVPVRCSDEREAQVLVAQVLVSSVPAACRKTYEICK